MNALYRQLGASLAGVAVLAMTATACGGGSSSASAAKTGAATSAAAAATSAAAAAAATSAGAAAAATSAGTAGTSAAGATSANAAATTSAAPLSAAPITSVKATGGGDFCKDLASAINASTAAASDGTTPAAVKATIQQSEALFGQLLLKAPSAIKADVTQLFSATTALYTAVAAAGYDYSKVPASALTAMEAPGLTGAETRVDAYVKLKCGIDTGAAASS